MPPEPLSAAVLAFLRVHIQAVEQLEILLLISSPKREAWSHDSVYDVILSSETSVAHWLDDLSRQGLLLREAGPPPLFHRTTDPALAIQLADLAHAYKTAPVRVIEAIYRRDADAAQSFADAFRLNPPPPPP